MEAYFKTGCTTFSSQQFIFHQDGAPVHTSKASQDWLVSIISEIFNYVASTPNMVSKKSYSTSLQISSNMNLNYLVVFAPFLPVPVLPNQRGFQYTFFLL